MKKLLLIIFVLLSFSAYAQEIHSFLKNDTIKKVGIKIVLRKYGTTIFSKPVKNYDKNKYKFKVKEFKENDTIDVYGVLEVEEYHIYDYYLVTYVDGVKSYFNPLYVKDEDSLNEYVSWQKYLFKKQRELNQENKEIEIWNEYKTGCEYFKNEIDEFSGDKKIFTESYNLNTYKDYGEEISITLRSLNGEKYAIFYTSHDLGCAVSHKRNRSSVKIKLENGTIVSFYHFGKTDCGNFSIIADLTKSDILKLKESPIKTIRLSGTDSYHDIESVKWKTFFIDKLDCIN